MFNHKLSSTNFLLWKSQVYRLIHGAQLFHYIEGEAPTKVIQQGETKIKNLEFKIWINNDRLLTG